jgi:putative methyltransferase (TIGR04325 family)
VHYNLKKFKLGEKTINMSVIQKLHRYIDLLGGLYVGTYRAGYSTTRPAPSKSQNENAHYLLTEAQLAARVAQASEAILSSTTHSVAYWMERMLHGTDNPLVCDFGGGYGLDYFRLSRLRTELMRWVVAEIPEIVAHAKQVPLLHPISFSDQCPTSPDLFYSNGVVMNADGPLFDAIESTASNNLIITGVECVPHETFYTWQVNRKTKRRCAYVTHNQQAFVSRFEAMGYELLGEWEMGKSGSGVFLKPGLDVNYYGFAFNRAT